jgi:hypothetical protein
MSTKQHIPLYHIIISFISSFNSLGLTLSSHLISSSTCADSLPDATQRPSQVRRMLQDDDMPVDDAPADEGDGAPRQAYNFAPGYHGIVYRADVPDTGASRDRQHAHTTGGEGQRDVDAAHEEEEEAGAGDGDDGDDDDARHPANEKTQEGEEEGGGEAHPAQTSPPTSSQVRYKLQSMKWGLVPSWTRRAPDYATTLKTINCRDDSLAMPGGMWASMKNRKRCIVVAQGFYEWREADVLCWVVGLRAVR